MTDTFRCRSCWCCRSGRSVGDDPSARRGAVAPAKTLAQIAGEAGCRLAEIQDGHDSNPPVTGRFRESAWTADGSYAGMRAPSLEATIHAMLHGRVLLQYRPDLPERDVRVLDRVTRTDGDRVLLFQNQTGMRRGFGQHF